MKATVIIIFCVFIAYFSNGQTDSVVVNGRVLEIMRCPFGYLKFNPGTSDVTQGWIGYLDEIGRYYSKDLMIKRGYYIELTPMAAKSEKELAERLTQERVKFIFTYLKSAYKIPGRHIVVRDSNFSEDVGAVQVIVQCKDVSQLTKKQRRERMEESIGRHVLDDKYFKE